LTTTRPSRGLDARQIDRVIRANLERLGKPGVLSVRPGYEITGHRLTGRPAIVVTVHTKRAPAPSGAALPAAIEGIPVDVREATPHQRLRARDPAAAAIALAYGPPELAQPSWPYERLMPGGKLLRRPGAAAAASRVAEPPALAARASKPQLPYVPPPGFPLQPVTVTTTLTASVSPDAGLATLTAFLQGATTSLVVGMYDFTSARILALFEQTLAPSARRLDLVLDNPPPNPTRDQTDTQTAAALAAALGTRARIARALSRTDTLANAWIFPSAYHIKVIVRDGSAVWLSSGNLDNSNLPDPAQPPATQDRDWHVIAQDPALAALFTAYLENDLQVASAHQAAVPAEIQRAVDDARLKLVEDTRPLAPAPPPLRPRAAAAAAPVAAQTFSAISAVITPLLTPDTLPGQPGTGAYQSRILALIASARTSLYLQMQYVETPADDAAGGFKQLLAAVLERLQQGIDVRIIESLEYGEVWAEKMKTLPDVDLTPAIRLQANVHNKGIVVDSHIVVVSSQNWSAAGVLQNRDAGLIIDNAPVAQYFQNVFLDDWKNRSQPFAPATPTRPTARRRRT